MKDEIINYDSPDAATYQAGLSGWVSRRGFYFGDDPNSEDMARWDGCTHKSCQYCGASTPKGYTACDDCRRKREIERYEAMPRAEWDGVVMLYSNATGKYYADLDDLEDDLDEGETLADLRLVICEPEYVRQLDVDFFEGQIPDDGSLPPAVEAAMDAFNSSVAGIIVSWSPGKKALALSGKAQ